MKLCSSDLCWTSSWLFQSVHGLRHCELRKRGHKERHRGSADTEKATQEIARLSVSADTTDMIQVVLAQGSAVFFSFQKGNPAQDVPDRFRCQREKTPVGDGMAAGYKEKSRTTTPPLE